MTDWKSSTLQCYTGDDHCAICRFIDGDRRAETMLLVIKQLDETLAKTEAVEHALATTLAELVRKNPA